MAHPKLEEVRAIAQRLRDRNVDAEVEGEARWWLTILRGSDQLTRDRAADELEALMRSRGCFGARRGRPPATRYQVANTQFRWWAICRRISRWERIYRRRYHHRAPLLAACKRVSAEAMAFDADTLSKRWQRYGQKIP